ncbi:Murein DD-endopeptidase MepM [compost metagenome]
MIIPGANRRTVRIKLPHSSLYIMPSVILLVFSGLIWTIVQKDAHFKETTGSMQQSFNGQERQLTDQLEHKKSELITLQTELIEISIQADEFKTKLAEMKELEQAIDLITQPVSTSRNSSKTSSSNIPIGDSTKKPAGGIEIPVTSQDVSQLVTDTKQELNVLVKDINGLIVSLTQSEATLLEAQRIRNLTPTLWPVNSRRVTSHFGIRLDPFTGKPSGHTGIDIDGELGDAVYAAAAGKVTLTDSDGEHGNYIRIDHTLGMNTQYLHLSKILVKVGEQVTKGQKIGLVGSTGRSTGTHLHYEVLRSGVQIDPTPYLLSQRKDE